MLFNLIFISGIGRIIINSMSKITKIIAIRKKWFENLKFFSDKELNPHSTLDCWEKIARKFCFIINIIITINKMIINEIYISLFIISEWEFSLFYRIRII